MTGPLVLATVPPDPEAPPDAPSPNPSSAGAGVASRRARDDTVAPRGASSTELRVAVEELARLTRGVRRNRARRISARSREEGKFAATLDANDAGARSTHGPSRSAGENAVEGAREPVRRSLCGGDRAIEVGQHRSPTRDARSPDCRHPRARGEVRWVRLDKGYPGIVAGRRGEEVDQRENNSFRPPAARATSAPFRGTHM